MTLDSETLAAPASTDAPETAAAWLTEFGRAFAAGDKQALCELFAPDAVWRDVVAFSWDIRNWVGADDVAGAFAEHAARRPSGFRVKAGTVPQALGEGEAGRIAAFFDFETDSGVGDGIVHLVPAATPLGWAAAAIYTALEALKDHPWLIDEHRPVGRGHGFVPGRPDPADLWEEAVSFRNRDPQVVVLGAGHNGLMIAARLERLGVDTLVIDREPKVGDHWRGRYGSLALHNKTEVNDFPFMPFPPSFPTYLPKDALGDFMEYYAKAMELKVWNNSTIEKATYDDNTKKWTLSTRTGDGPERVIHAPHLVIATGLNGNPVIPDFPGVEDFKGTLIHSGKFGGGRAWAGKKAVVIGAGVSAHDIAQDLAEHNADVTLIQRSSTYIVHVDSFHKYFYADYFVPGITTDLADIASSMLPLGVVRERGMLAQMVSLMAEDDKQLLDDLKARGFAYDFRANGNGNAETHFSGRDSYYFDIGASRMIADGQLPFRSGIGVERFTENGVVLSDGSELDADLVVSATGYTSLLDAVRPIIGDDVADGVGSVWRWGDDREITGVYRKTVQPGLWFMTGTIRDSRVYSKFMALHIKAIEEGLDSF